MSILLPTIAHEIVTVCTCAYRGGVGSDTLFSTLAPSRSSSPGVANDLVRTLCLAHAPTPLSYSSDQTSAAVEGITR